MTILFACASNLAAQVNGVFVDNLKTLKVEVNGMWEPAPVVPLVGANYVLISFDDLQHNFVRRTYHIRHCNADWTPSELIESEYLDGFNDRPIDDYSPSMNTTTLYNHYSFRIPNKDVRLTVSGNYIVDIYEEGDDEPVGRACFSVLDNHVGVAIGVSPNTDIDQYDRHQQLSLSLNYQSYSVNRPEEELHPVILQNRRWDTKVENIRPSEISTYSLSYDHNRNLIFPAGNEYRRFEILDEYVPTMHVEKLDYHAPYYHASLYPDEARKNYIYDQDQDGRFLIRNSDNVENETESDYFITHFRLEMPEIPYGTVYLNGDMSYNTYSDEYAMEYDTSEGAYILSLLLKQGAYNYQYVFIPDDSKQPTLSETEGNYYQTENEYSVYVYHRPFGARYDHLVGYSSVKTSLR